MLRERSDDILQLAAHFMALVAAVSGDLKPIRRGLIVGVLVGHFLDRGVERVRTFNPFRPYAPGEKQASPDSKLWSLCLACSHASIASEPIAGTI